MNELDCAILFRPNLHTKIWGGSAIKQYKSLDSDLVGIGESWEVSALPGAESVVATGALEGLTLGELVARYGAALLGSRVYGRYGAHFPLLVKIIDADQDLSMQVHPCDSVAMRRHNARGNTEMWYVLSSRPGAKIHIGLSRRLKPESLGEIAAAGRIGDYVASYDSRPGDTFFIPAGRIHSIGAGNLLVEVQQSSDITYRIYDYGRRDAGGNLRELHIDQARESVDYTVSPDYRNKSRHVAPGHDEIVDCDYFRVDRLEVDGELAMPADPDSFRIFMCLDGEVTFTFNGTSRPGSAPVTLHRGQTVLIPACAPSMTITGHAAILSIQP